MFTNNELMNETDKLKRFAYKLTQNIHDAEDLLHSTIVKAIDKKNMFKPGTNLFSWVSKIMYNMFVSLYRRKTKFETQYDPESYIEREKVEASQETKSELKQVQRAMKTLPKDHRQVLNMICVRGDKYTEVAKKLKVPIGTVRSRLSRAREGLNKALNNPNMQQIAA